MLDIKQLPRLFLFEEKGQQIELADPEVTFSPQAVQNFYSNTYPVLTTATIEGPTIEDDRVLFKFKSTIGTKG